MHVWKPNDPHAEIEADIAERRHHMPDNELVFNGGILQRYLELQLSFGKECDITAIMKDSIERIEDSLSPARLRSVTSTTFLK